MNFISRFFAALLVGAGLALAGWLLAQGLERFRMADRVVTVKGLAEQDVPSDYATWALSFRRAGNGFGDVQRALAADRERVLTFLRGRGFTEAELETRPLQVQDLLALDYAQSNLPFRFNGSGQILVKTSRVAEVTRAALAVDPLIQAGLQLGGAGDASGGPRYQLRGFNDIKAPLLAEATRNAREQAQKFAAEAGAELGALKSANQGVIQISSADGDGYDDGSSPNKRLRVVSTFSYELK